jgi:hypothetical protein
MPDSLITAQWLSDSLERVETKIDHIDREGCAQREGDLKQLQILNGKVDEIKMELRTDIVEVKSLLTKIYIAVVACLLSGIGFLFQQAVSHFISHPVK